MTKHFTKEEAILYLGEVLLITQDYQSPNHSSEFVKAGEVGKVQSLDVWDGFIKLCVDIYGNYHSLDKPEFEKHCQLLKPEITSLKSQSVAT